MKDELASLRVKVAELSRKNGQLEMDLKDVEGRFLKIFHASPNLMTIITLKEGRMADLNEASASFLGYKREELIGHLPADNGLFVDPNFGSTLIRKLQEEGSVRNLETKVRTKDGDIRTLLMSADPIRVDNEPCLLTVSVDVTAREQEADAG
jgi:PAS domain S-box-containing protein